jgi:acyl-CoA thioesterase FadM
MSTEAQHVGAFLGHFRVRFHEVDRAGVMFFGHVLTRAHEVYEDFMGSLGYPLNEVVESRGWRIPLVEARASFAAPMRHEEEITVRLQVRRIGHSSYDLEFDLHGADGASRARVQTTHVLRDGAGGALALPERLRQGLQGHVSYHALS